MMGEENRIRTSDNINSSDNHQTILSSGAGTFTVTLDNARCIENNTDTGGFIEFLRTKSTIAERSYFNPGQMKVIKVSTVYGSGGALGGSTVNCEIWE